MPSDETDTPMWSGKCPPPVRHASPTDLSTLGDLLGRSLCDDPLLRWIFPDDLRRRKGVASHFSHLLKPRIRDGVVTTIDCKSVAVWMPPNPPRQTIWERYRESFQMRIAHRHRVHLVRNCFQRMAERHPTTPHWYLLALATEDACQGQGLAGRLLEEMFLHSDREGQNVVLETSKESNLIYYEKFGFVMTDELQVDEELKVWLMCRPAANTDLS